MMTHALARSPDGRESVFVLSDRLAIHFRFVPVSYVLPGMKYTLLQELPLPPHCFSCDEECIQIRRSQLQQALYGLAVHTGSSQVITYALPVSCSQVC